MGIVIGPARVITLANGALGDQSICAAEVVYWNHAYHPAEQGGLAGLNRPGPQARALGAGLVSALSGLGTATGVLWAAATTESTAASWSCEVGIIAVASQRVFLLGLGKVQMDQPHLPRDLGDQVPTDIRVTGVVGFRPLTASNSGEELSVTVLGSPIGCHSAFHGGSCLKVRVLGRIEGGHIEGAGRLATLIRAMGTYPSVHDTVTALLICREGKVDEGVVNAFQDQDYVISFGEHYKKVAREIRRALILTSRQSPDPVRMAISQCARQFGAGAEIRYFLGFILILIGSIVAGTLGWEFSQEPEFSGGIAALSMIPFTLIATGLWIISSARRFLRERKLESQWLAKGAEYSCSLANQLALITSEADRWDLIRWSEVSSGLNSNARFKKDLGTAFGRIRNVDAGALINAAPDSLRVDLLRELQSTEVTISGRFVAIFCAIQIPCMILGIVALGGFVEVSATGWMFLFLVIFIGFGGLPSASVIVLTFLVRAARRPRIRLTDHRMKVK